jgi:hypothetical protein
MKGLKRKVCDAVPCRPSPFFRPAVQRASADETFFQHPLLQRQSKDEEKKDPLTEGLTTTGGKLLEHEPFKQWYEPKLHQLRYTLWDKATTADKAAMLTFLGLNLGTGIAAFSMNPGIRKTLSDVNIGKPLGWIPYSPLEGFKYKLPDASRPGYGFSADFTLNPYLELLHKHHRLAPLAGATFGLESTYDPARKSFGLTGGKFGLELFGGALKAEGKTFNELSPYPQLLPGSGPGESPSWLMQEVPGMPMIKRPGYQFMLNADLLKLFPQLRKYY